MVPKVPMASMAPKVPMTSMVPERIVLRVPTVPVAYMVLVVLPLVYMMPG